MEQLSTEVEQLRKENAELKVRNKDLIQRNAMLRQRPDLPVDRIPATQEYEKQIAELRTAEKNTSSAYLRIRELVNAFDTPYAPTPEQVYELTERKIKELQAENADLRETMKDWVAFQKEHSVMYNENLELKAHVERLREHLTELTSWDYKKWQDFHETEVESIVKTNEDAVLVLAKTPPQSLAAHDAEVRKQERERCAVTAWMAGMDAFNNGHKYRETREQGAFCADAIRNMPDVEGGE